MEKLSTYVKLRVELCGALVKEAAKHKLVSDLKREIPKFDTVRLLHSNWSNLRRKYLSKILIDIYGLSGGQQHRNFRKFRTPFPPARHPQKFSLPNKITPLVSKHRFYFKFDCFHVKEKNSNVEG